MTEGTQVSDVDAAATTELSAGAMLRQARERQGMHIAMLASVMKVTPKKLEALEADRISDLPDVAFARALAQTICRTLKIDAEPILAKLPSIGQPDGLVKTSAGLAAPFRDHGDSHTDAGRWTFLRHPVFWATAAVLVGAVLVAMAPSSWIKSVTSLWSAERSAASTVVTSAVQAPAPSASAAVVTPVAEAASASVDGAASSVAGAAVAVVAAAAPAVDQDLVGPQRPDAASTVVVETVHSAPSVAPAMGPAGATDGAKGVITIRARSEAWVEVVDANKQTLIARSLQAGESIGIDGAPPFKVRLGNVQGTDLSFKGEAVNVAAKAVGNMARLELK